MKQRILTAVLAGVLFLLVAWAGGYPFTGMTLLLAIIGYWEFLVMKKITLVSFSGILGFIVVILIVVPESFHFISLSTLLLAVLLLLLLGTVLSKNAFHFDRASFIVFSALYVSFGFHYMIITRMETHGLSLLFFILLVIWSADSGAYSTGRTFGKHKLWPKISPKKTIEGSMGGIISALVVAGIFQLLFSPFSNLGTALLVGFIISIFGQIGDLVESAFKRHYGVKDSGHILPGHGGILDRCDSWLFVFPVLYLFHFI